MRGSSFGYLIKMKSRPPHFEMIGKGDEDDGEYRKANRSHTLKA